MEISGRPGHQQRHPEIDAEVSQDNGTERAATEKLLHERPAKRELRFFVWSGGAAPLADYLVPTVGWAVAHEVLRAKIQSPLETSSTSTRSRPRRSEEHSLCLTALPISAFWP